VGDSLTLLDMFLRGLGVGAAAVLGLSSLQPGVSQDQRGTVSRPSQVERGERPQWAR
jgi:hypothetical protein